MDGVLTMAEEKKTKRARVSRPTEIVLFYRVEGDEIVDASVMRASGGRDLVHKISEAARQGLKMEMLTVPPVATASGE